MSNLIALQNSSNTLGLGTSHIGLGTTGSSVLPFKKNDGTILMNFNTSNNSINLGTIGSGVCQGSVIEPAYGGLGMTTLGLANEVLAVNSLGNYNWTNNEMDLTTTTEISTNVTSTIGIGSISHDLTINTSKLTINIGNNIPQEGQILKYNNDGLIWSDSNSDSIDKLWTLIKNFHPGYVLFLKSIQVSGTNTTNDIIPSFDPIITDYSINVNDNLTVSITPNKFNIPSNTTEATTLINNSVIQDSYIILNSTPNSNTFTIKNSYTENSETFDKSYTLNVVRNQLTDNNLNSLTITDQNSNNITLNETLGVGTVYTIDVNTNVKNIKMTSTINRTVQRLGIGTVSSGTDTPLNISKNNDSIIGIGTGFVGIGTTDVFDTNIESGRISDVFLNIKAENNSDKQYTFKISNPPRNNTELDEIKITKIKIDDTPESPISIINPSENTEIDINNSYKQIKFEIKKKHLDQTISIVKHSTNSNSEIVYSDSIVGHTFITQLSTFSNYIQPQDSNSIVDNFKITNTAENQLDSITYQIKCTKTRSSNTVPKSIKITSGSNILIERPNSVNTLDTLNHSEFNNYILASDSVTIEVIKDGGQAITLLGNTTGINESDDVPFGLLNSKTISISSNLELYNFLLEVEAEKAGTKETYNISITAAIPPEVQSFIISDTSLKIGETATVTIVFTEAVYNFNSNQDITVQNGSLSTMTSYDNGITWSGTFSPNDNIEETNNVLTLSSNYTDINGNTGLSATSDNYVIDTKRPLVQLFSISDTSLKFGDTATVTITFTEAVSNFNSNQDITVQNGSLSTMTTSNNGITWSGTFSPNYNIEDTTNVITLSTNYTDINGNTGLSATSSNYVIDTKRPYITNFSLSGYNPYQQGDIIYIYAYFNQNVTYNSPKIQITGQNTLSKTNMIHHYNNTVYKYTHSVGNGDGTATIYITDATDSSGNTMESTYRSITITAATPGLLDYLNITTSWTPIKIETRAGHGNYPAYGWDGPRYIRRYNNNAIFAIGNYNGILINGVSYYNNSQNFCEIKLVTAPDIYSIRVKHYSSSSYDYLSQYVKSGSAINVKLVEVSPGGGTQGSLIQNNLGHGAPWNNQVIYSGHYATTESNSSNFNTVKSKKWFNIQFGDNNSSYPYQLQSMLAPSGTLYGYGTGSIDPITYRSSTSISGVYTDTFSFSI